MVMIFNDKYGIDKHNSTIINHNANNESDRFEIT
jgi:hypothetical protein